MPGERGDPTRRGVAAPTDRPLDGPVEIGSRHTAMRRRVGENHSRLEGHGTGQVGDRAGE
jgi:hypothetical protein